MAFIYEPELSDDQHIYQNLAWIILNRPDHLIKEEEITVGATWQRKQEESTMQGVKAILGTNPNICCSVYLLIAT